MWKGDKIIAMDLSADGRQKIIQLPFIVDSISWTGEGEVLICTSTNGHEIWSLRFNLPAYSLQRIHLKSSSSWRLNSLHFSALTLSKTCLMSDAKSLADSFLLSLRNQELWRYPRGDSAVPNPHFRPAFLFHSPNTMITVFDGGSSSNGKVLGLVEIIDLSKCTVKTILMELAEPKNATMKLCCLISLDSDAVLLVDSGGFAWHIQVSQSSLESRFETWKMMIGTNNIISKSGDGNEEIGFGGGGDDDESDGNNGNSQYPGIRLVTKFYGARKLRKVDLDRMTLVRKTQQTLC
jgi:hypothetical protein